MNAIAGFTISGLSDGIDTLTISDLFAPEDLNSGVLYLIDRNTTISNLPNALSTALESSTIDELISADIVDSPDKYYSQSLKMYKKEFWLNDKPLVLRDENLNIFSKLAKLFTKIYYLY